MGENMGKKMKDGKREGKRETVIYSVPSLRQMAEDGVKQPKVRRREISYAQRQERQDNCLGTSVQLEQVGTWAGKGGAFGLHAKS